MANLKSKGVLLSAPVELEFQQGPVNVNLINCTIPRTYVLPLCRCSWWRWNSTESLRALPSLPNNSTSPLCEPSPTKERRDQCCGCGLICTIPQCFGDQRYIKVWSSWTVMLLLTWCHYCYRSCMMSFVPSQPFLLYYTEPCKAMQTAEMSFFWTLP